MGSDVLVDRRPRVSIVTPIFGQASDIVETIESVMRQKGSDVEHVVIDGGSTDGARERLGRYPHLKVVSEPNRAHADLVNRGFGLASGQIWGMLSAGDVLVPGALDRVAREIDAARGRHIVMGRCRLVDAQGRYTGIEHPSHFGSRRRVLEAWKGQAIPSPAVFWTADVWRACGPVDETLRTPWIDYELFCRFSRAYAFHFVDHVFASRRLHTQAEAGRVAEADRLEACIRLSRRHWGSPFTPLYWRLALSLAQFRFDRVGRARRRLGRGKESWRRGRLLPAAAHAMVGAFLAPRVGFYVGLYPALRDRGIGIWRQALNRVGPVRGVPPETAAYLDRTDAWADGWVGPRLVLSREAQSPAGAVDIRGWTDLRYLGRSFVLTVRVDHKVVGQHRIRRPGDFAARVPLPAPLAPGTHTVEIEASGWFVPGRFSGNGDFRPLAWRMGEVSLEAIGVGQNTRLT